jgi:O-methyltransferase involved in polyketide biosynthesis
LEVDEHGPNPFPGAIDPATMLSLRSRADEHRRDNALFRDPLAARWTELLPWRADPTAPYGQQTQTRLAVRARAFDDATERFLRPRDVRKYLIQRRYLRALVQPLVVEIGGGLSTRYHRVGRGRARWIEVDLPDAIALRRRLEAESFEHRFLARSPTDPGWLSELPGISPTEMLFIVEGGFTRVDQLTIRTLIDRLREQFAGATFVFDIAEELPQASADRLSEAGSSPRLTVADEADVIALGLRPFCVWQLTRQYPERWAELRSRCFRPPLTDIGVLVEAMVEPPAE